MNIVDVIMTSQEITANWLKDGLLSDCRNCGCPKCLRMLEAIKEAEESPPKGKKGGKL